MTGRRPAILLLSADYAPGNWSGIGVAVHHQHRALLRAGANVRTLVACADGARAADDAVEFGDPRSWQLEARAPDWLHVHSLGLAQVALRARRQRPVRLAYTTHGCIEAEPLHGLDHAQRAPWIAAQRALWRAADRLVFPGRREAQLACELERGIASKVITIANGIESPAAAASPRRAARGPILFVGRYALSKGLDLLAQLVPALLERQPEPFHFIGGHGDVVGTRIVNRLCERFPERCKDRGWLGQEELAGVLSAASLLLMPSLYEPFGLVALEAMRLGVPVLASHVGGLIELLTGESGGVTMHERDPARWLAQALHILGSPALYARLSSCGPAHVGRHYGSDLCARRLMSEVYVEPVIARACAARTARWT